MACCAGGAPGATASNPVTLGDPGGPVIQVHVDTRAGGMTGRLAFVTGTAVARWIAQGHIRPVD